LEAIEGIGPKTVEKISVAVNNYFATLEGGEAMSLPENEGEEYAAQAQPAAAEELAEETAEGARPEAKHVAETPENAETAETAETDKQ
jgi:Holliday junction resolvasome RuvABC DNA-binding subunit